MTKRNTGKRAQCVATTKTAGRYHRGGEYARCQKWAKLGSKYCSSHSK